MPLLIGILSTISSKWKYVHKCNVRLVEQRPSAILCFHLHISLRRQSLHPSPTSSSTPQFSVSLTLNILLLYLCAQMIAPSLRFNFAKWNSTVKHKRGFNPFKKCMKTHFEYRFALDICCINTSHPHIIATLCWSYLIAHLHSFFSLFSFLFCII